MKSIKFGTDGWRAVISDQFTFENVKIVAQAMSDYVKRSRPGGGREKKIVVGYDTRFLSDKYAELTARVAASNGISVILADRPSPTPSASFAIKEMNLDGGIVVTASHNPARYNGMKYKAYYSGSANTGITMAIEGLLGRNKVKISDFQKLTEKGLISKRNILARHLAFMKKFVDLDAIRKRPLKILVDSMYGVGRGHIASLLKGSKCRVDTIHNEINPSFGGINPEPIMPNLEELARLTKKGNYDIGLATDGDADRLGVVLPTGKLLTGHKVMTLLLLHLVEDKGRRGDVVQTICGSLMIERICKRYGLKTHETPVGFKYICDVMLKDRALIGGEETGGVAFDGYIPERDGILSALLILEMLSVRRKPMDAIIGDIEKIYGTHEYRRLDIRGVPAGKKKRLMERLKRDPFRRICGKKVVILKDYDGYKFVLEDLSWFMIRLSGTEPIVRVYAEASNEKEAMKMLEFGRRVVKDI